MDSYPKNNNAGRGETIGGGGRGEGGGGAGGGGGMEETRRRRRMWKNKAQQAKVAHESIFLMYVLFFADALFKLL